MIHKIGVLTSGGDAPGMNCAIRAVVRSGLKHGLEVYGIIDGYKGLVEDRIFKMDRSSVSGIINRGGTVLRTARLPEFKNEEVRKIGVENLKKRGIDALVVIGGDGSYMGAKKLTEMGINCIGIPGTIDNDIASSDYTIGFDTCLNTINFAIDRIRDTSESHQRCAIVEVMGNRCGDLAVYSGIAQGAEIIDSSDHPLSEEEIINSLKEIHSSGRKMCLLIVSEKLFPDIHAFAKRVSEETGFEAKAEILGRIQRGGSPSAFDRVLGARLGGYAVDLLLQGKGGRCVGIHGNDLVDYDIYDALKLPRASRDDFLALADSIK